MKTKFVAIVSSLLIVALVLPLAAEDKKPAAKGKKPAAKKGDAGSQLLAATLKKFEKAELNEEQIGKVKDLVASYAPKLNEARQKQGLSKEQAAAQKAAREKAQADGLKGKAVAEAVDKALNLSEEQKAARAELQKLTGEFNTAVLGLLSAEQKEKAGIKRGGAKKPGAKKPAAKKPAAKAADK